MPHSRQELLIKCDRKEEIEIIINQLQDVRWPEIENYYIPKNPE